MAHSIPPINMFYCPQGLNFQFKETGSKQNWLWRKYSRARGRESDGVYYNVVRDGSSNKGTIEKKSE